MNVNFGLFPPLSLERKTKKADRKLLYTDRARGALAEWIDAEAVSSPLLPKQAEPAGNPASA